jgi:hypothetical protein
MPDRRRHRGPHPDDATLFASEHEPRLRRAVADLGLLLSRGYGEVAATKLVGDRFQLHLRQRIAVRRCACSEAQRRRRIRTRIPGAGLAGQPLVIDGFNVLITIEAAMAGGVLLRGRDGCVRDLASMHGSWKRMVETPAAIIAVLDLLAAAGPRSVTFVLDSPVGNSGRLAAALRAAARARGTACEVELSSTADRALLAAPAVVATADSAVLDRAARWTDLVGEWLLRAAPTVWLLDLAPRRRRSP